MILRIKNEFQKRKEDNKGAALVLVTVAIAFIGMLVAMILYMAYCNYLMKSNDSLSKNNFYTAEYALEVINAGIQQDISESMSRAYVETMQNSSGKTTDELTFGFRDRFIEEIKDKLQYVNPVTGAKDENRWNVTHLQDMWTDNGITLATAPGVTGAYLAVADGGDNTLTLSGKKDYLTMADLYIVYTDAKGYVSIISTDIRVKVPKMDFAQSTMNLDIENYSIIANNALINGDDGVADGAEGVTKGGTVDITGNVFGGYEGVQNIGQKITRFKKDPNDEANGRDLRYKLIAESIEASNSRESGSGIYVDEQYETYVNDIGLETARLEMNGDVYVGDDLDISGRGSIVRLTGKYRGYGNVYGESEGSSSILINGADTILDFSGLQELVLSGHAYVGAKKYDADRDRLLYVTEAEEDRTNIDTSDKISESADYNKLLEDAGEGDFQENENTIPQNQNDVMMGESISVKANQLLYMVPTDCVGYRLNSDEQVIKQNPMRYEDYKMLTETQVQKVDEAGQPVNEAGQPVMEDVYEPVRLSVLWNRLGGIAYTSNYRAVYRRVNGSVMVYLYLDFGGDEATANAFFKAYYDHDPAGVQKYVDSYIRDLEWGNELDNSVNLTLAGNAFKYNAAGELQLVDDSKEDAEKNVNMISMQENYSNIQESLMHTLSPNYLEMSSAQQGVDIFDSLVDKAALQRFGGLDFVKKNSETDPGIRALISNNDVVYSDGMENVKLIVTSKDVYVADDFDGLIVAGGNIYICEGCTEVYYSPTEVLQAMQASYTYDNGETVHAYDVFGLNGRLSYGIAVEDEEGKNIKLGELITYENWKKE